MIFVPEALPKFSARLLIKGLHRIFAAVDTGETKVSQVVEGLDATTEDGVKATPIAAASGLAATVISTAAEGGVIIHRIIRHRGGNEVGRGKKRGDKREQNMAPPSHPTSQPTSPTTSLPPNLSDHHLLMIVIWRSNPPTSIPTSQPKSPQTSRTRD
jgi:hypothetical protein